MNDYIVGGYEGPAGGAIACTEVHTLFTDIPPAHYDLDTCLLHLIGKVYLDGDALNTVQSNIDKMCTALGSCTYQQEQALKAVSAAISQAMRVKP